MRMHSLCAVLIGLIPAAGARATLVGYFEYGYDPQTGERRWQYDRDDDFADQWAREYNPLQDRFEWEYMPDEYDFYQGRVQEGNVDWGQYEWDPSRGLHREEWYDPSDWFDDGGGSQPYAAEGDNYYTEDWFRTDDEFSDWYDYQ